MMLLSKIRTIHAVPWTNATVRERIAFEMISMMLRTLPPDSRITVLLSQLGSHVDDFADDEAEFDEVMDNFRSAVKQQRRLDS